MSLELVHPASEQTNAAPHVPVQTRKIPHSAFKPGISGNPGGRPRSAYFRKKALKQLRQEIAAGVDRGDTVLDAIVSKAADGDMIAAEFLRDTVDGPVAAAQSGFSVNVNLQSATIVGSGNKDE